MEGPAGYVTGLAVTPDGKRAVSDCGDRMLKVWDLESSEVLATFTCDGSADCCVCAALNQIVAGDAGGHLHFLRLVEPKPKF